MAVKYEFDVLQGDGYPGPENLSLLQADGWEVLSILSIPEHLQNEDLSSVLVYIRKELQ